MSIYLLFDCNDWRELSSMDVGSPIAVATSKEEFDVMLAQDLDDDAKHLSENVIIDNIGSLGTNLYNNYQIITTLLINKVIVLFADAPIPLKRQIDPNFNKQFLAGIQYHLYSLKEQENNNKKSVGRPVVQYPVGWEQHYAKWKNKEISSKTFMEQMGLKKATFYNLLTEYKSEKNI